MAQVLTNNTTLAYAIESSPGVLPGSPTWKTLEPNNIGKYGAEITTVARNPISALRQRRKGTVVDLDAASEHDADLTIASLVDFAEGFLYAAATNADLTFVGRSVNGTGFIIPAATAAQAAKLQFTSGGPISLVFAAGYQNAANNGMKPLTADTGLAGTALAFSGAVVETAPTNAEVSIAGIRAEAGDLAFSRSGDIGTLTSGNGASSNPINFTTLGLTVGQWVHIGGLLAANQFAGASSVKSLGYARIRAIAAGSLTLDKLDSRLINSDGTSTGAGGTEIPTDLLFGRFIRNVPVTSSEFLRRTYQFEAGYDQLYETDPPTPVANPDGFEYVKGNYANEMTWEMPLTDKSTITFAFIALNTDDLVDNSGRKTNAATPIAPLQTGAFNTSADFARLRIADVDATGLTSDFKDMTVTVANGVTPEKVLGRLGARYVNLGNFELDVETEALFTSPLVVARIKANTTATMDWILRNDDGAIVADVPSCTIGNGAKSFPLNESVRIALEVQAHADSFFGTSFSLSLFPATPAHPVL